MLEKGKYIIFLDVDGTVYDGKGVPKRNVEALARAKALGHKVFLNTGRAYCILPQALMDAVKPDGVVCAMGTTVYVGAERIFSAHFTQEDAEILLRFGDTYALRTLPESEERLVSLRMEAFEGQDHFAEDTDDLFRRYPDMKVCKVSYMQEVDESLLAPLRGRFHVYAHSGYAEIPAHGCDKATGIAAVCAYYGVGREAAIAIGDSGNDYDMVKYAGVGVAMGNASADIKAIADFVTLTCEEGGVGHAVEELVLKNEV